MLYYEEPVVKDTKERQEYLNSIEAFLQEKKAACAAGRNAFISPEKYKNNPEKYRAAFIEMLGFPLTEASETPTLEKTFVAQDKNVNIYRIRFYFPCGIATYGLYFEQIEQRDDTPFVIAFHGGAGTPELVSSIHGKSANYNHLARRITDRGANVFAPQLLLWSTETYGNPYERDIVDGKLRQLGGSLTALELWITKGYINYFEKNGIINGDRLGVAGLSYGGMYALHLAAVDTRIKACYSCSWVCDGFAWSKGDWSYKNALSTFTVAETLALVAPRALAVAMGDHDPLFNADLTSAECRSAEAYYNAFEAPDRFFLKIFDGNHETDKADDELEFLFKHLA